MWLVALRYAVLTVLALMVAGIMFVAGVYTGRLTEKAQEPPPVIEVPLSQQERARAFLEVALAARFVGRHSEALTNLEEARRLYPLMRGLDYQFALTYLDLDDYDDAMLAAQRSIEKKEEMGNAHALIALATIEKAQTQGSLELVEDVVMTRLDDARVADPLNSMPYYVLAEFHRMRGRPEPALIAYQRALERVSKTDSVLFSTVKAGLAGLRLHHGPTSPPYKVLEINGVIPPEQLFFGAADCLLRGDQEQAAVYLREAKSRLPEETFNGLLQDSFFQDYLPAGILDVRQPNDPPSVE
jgi:tetratricopeptide (TPR) repeat protein